MAGSFTKTVEAKIKKAIKRGDFDDLPGKGKPLEDSDWDKAPEEMRLAYKILKNAGFTPPEIQLRKKITQIEDLLNSTSDEHEKVRQLKKLNYLVTKLNMMRNIPITLEYNQRYLEKVVDKITVKKRQ